MSIGSLSLLRPLARKRTDTPRAAADMRAANPGRSVVTDATQMEEPVVSELKQHVNIVRPPGEVEDHELLKRFQQGDEDGYVELYLRRQAEVYTFCLRLAQGDADFASDLFQ